MSSPLFEQLPGTTQRRFWIWRWSFLSVKNQRPRMSYYYITGICWICIIWSYCCWYIIIFCCFKNVVMTKLTSYPLLLVYVLVLHWCYCDYIFFAFESFWHCYIFDGWFIKGCAIYVENPKISFHFLLIIIIVITTMYFTIFCIYDWIWSKWDHNQSAQLCLVLDCQTSQVLVYLHWLLSKYQLFLYFMDQRLYHTNIRIYIDEMNNGMCEFA